jgi:hypothetical protein
MSNEPTPNDALRDYLSRSSEITISVIGRKSGRTISNPVWFVLDGENLYLLPMQGSDTQWYKNLLKNPKMRIDARGTEAEFGGVPIISTIQSSTLLLSLRCGNGVSSLPVHWRSRYFQIAGKTGSYRFVGRISPDKRAAVTMFSRVNVVRPSKARGHPVDGELLTHHFSR